MLVGGAPFGKQPKSSLKAAQKYRCDRHWKSAVVMGVDSRNLP